MTKEAIQTREWEVLPHLLYSPDLAPENFHLFQCLSNAKRGVLFNSDAELKLGWTNFTCQNLVTESKRSIENLVGSWKELLNIKGEYIID